MPDDNKQQNNNNQNKDTLDLSKNPQFTQLASLVGQLGKNMQTMSQGFNNSIKEIKDIVAKGAAPPKKEEPPPSDKDLNEMDQASLVSHIFKGMRSMLDDGLKKFDSKLEGLSTNLEKKDLTTAVEKLRADNKDFDDWIPELKDKMSSNPALTVNEAFTLVKAANPDKAKQLAEKYKTELDKDDNTKPKPTFGGLTPTSGRRETTTDEEGDQKTLTQDQAAEKAWEETFGESPALAGEDTND